MTSYIAYYCIELVILFLGYFVQSLLGQRV